MPSALSVGIVADPGVARDIAEALADSLPASLAETIGGDRTWTVTTASRRLAADEQGVVRLATLGGGHAASTDMVVYLTDQPRREGVRAIVADVSLSDRMALASLPAFGARRVRKRVLEAIVRLVEELMAGEDGVADESDRDLGPFRRVVPADDHIDIRFLDRGLRGRLRLLSGMVWANRPWRLITGLSGAAAAAAATAAYVLITPSVWTLADALGGGRLAIAAVLANLLMVGWLIIDHELWERPAGRGARQLASLYNATTVITVAFGVVCVYAGLLVLAAVAEAVIIDRGLVTEAVRHPATWWTLALIGWLACSMGTVAGALGTGFQSDEAVRQAAYGFRQRERLQAEDEAKDRSDG